MRVVRGFTGFNRGFIDWHYNFVQITIPWTRVWSVEEHRNQPKRRTAINIWFRGLQKLPPG